MGVLFALLVMVFTGWLIAGYTVPEVATAALISLIGAIIGHWLGRVERNGNGGNGGKG